jgi:ABC-2 type transport system permease protein
MIIAYQSVGVVFISITANLRLGLMGASFYASTAYTFIGMTFPIIAFPLPARIWAECIPLTHYMRIYIDQAVMGAAVPLSIRSCVALVLFILLPFALSWRISRVMRDDSFLGGV